MTFPGRLTARSALIEDRVAVQAHCPVVTVSSAPQEVDDRRYVAVGWTHDPTGARALAAAVAEAAGRGASLTVVPGPTPAGEAPGSPKPGGPTAQDLHQALADVVLQHPAMTVTVDWPVSNWVQTLIGHSAHASLLVIGSHHSADRWSIRVGTTAGAVLRQASGPVMLIGGSATTPAEPSLTGRPRRSEPTTPAVLTAGRP